MEGSGLGHDEHGGLADAELEEVEDLVTQLLEELGPGLLAAQDDRLMAAHSYPSGQPVPYFVLDGFGGVHPAGGAPALTAPPAPYFGFDIAKDLEIR